MSTPQLRPSGPVGVAHPAVLDRRIRELALLALTGLIPAAIALGVTVALPHTSLLLILAIIAAALAVVALMVSSRLELTVALLAFYLLLLDGPVKLAIGSHEATAAVPNVLIAAVAAGALMRLVVSRQRLVWPALSSWVLAFVAIVVIEAFNPHTEGILKTLAGYRQQLEWVPFFFFGYLLMRSKRRFRQLFLIVGVAALANGAVSAYQTELSPDQLASWGPGYRLLVFPSGSVTGTGRTYTSEGEARVRPPGLGSDEGFGGGVGELALAFGLALLAVMRPRRRWVAALLCLGALLAILTSLGRSQVIGGGIVMASFAVFALLAGSRVSRRALAAILTVVVLALPAGVLVVSVLRSGTFSRYESIAGSKLAEAPGYKEGARSLLPHELSVNPFGVGLGTSGPTVNLGGKSSYVEQFRGISSETQYNFLANELGVPGVLLWFVLSVYMIVFVARGMRWVRDSDLAICLAGVFAPFVALFVGGFSGESAVSAAQGPYFWFAIGVAAYWFAGPGRRRSLMRSVRALGAARPGSIAPAGAA
jgi:hypothetical protein